MATKEKTLDDAFYETLKDVFYAEKASVRALKKSAKAAKSPELKQAFETHGEESANQVTRLEQVFELIGKPARAKTCEAISGIISEMNEDLEDFGDTPAGDAVLIGCGQAVEHYEIARYGMLKTWAQQLGHQDVADLLDQTLQEEKKTDELLSQIAEKSVNARANGEEADDSDDADDDEDDDAEESEDDGEAKKPAKTTKSKARK
jgi:ferritin-like metal-binding protein YciE